MQGRGYSPQRISCQHYYLFSQFLKERFECKIYELPINADLPVLTGMVRLAIVVALTAITRTSAHQPLGRKKVLMPRLNMETLFSGFEVWFKTKKGKY